MTEMTKYRLSWTTKISFAESTGVGLERKDDDVLFSQHDFNFNTVRFEE